MKKFFFSITVLLLFVAFVLSPTGKKEAELYSISTTTDKKVILIIVDSLLKEPLETLMAQNKVPLFQYLKENGWYTNKMISSFPTMSVTIDSSILTGSYSDKHRVPGLRWYDTKEQRLINYDDGAIPVVRSGVKNVIMDSLAHLNNRHLSKQIQTIHEEVADHGMSSASINSLIYRSNQLKKLHLPVPFQEVETMAPSYFVLGSFHHYLNANLIEQYFNYYGVNDQVSIEHLAHLIQNKALPVFTMVYLPDLDHDAHQHGTIPANTLIEVDQKLQRLFNLFGDWSDALENHVFMIMGDSGVVKMKENKQEAIVDLDKRLNAFNIAELGETDSSNQLALAVNERMAYIYSLQPHIHLHEIIDAIKEEERLDTISWKNGDWIEVMQGGSLKRFKFRPGSQYQDLFGQHWDIEGDSVVLDIQLNKERNRLDYGDYPDGLMRLYSAAHSHEGNFLIVTAKPGYEMQGVHSPTHVGGGAHGSFHREDSYFPLFIAGTEKRLASLRIVDLKPFILNELDDQTPRRIKQFK